MLDARIVRDSQTQFTVRSEPVRRTCTWRHLTLLVSGQRWPKQAERVRLHCVLLSRPLPIGCIPGEREPVAMARKGGTRQEE